MFEEFVITSYSIHYTKLYESLRFEEVPNVHWPETMVTFEPESGTLFSCDAFGSFGKLGKRVFDDEYYAEEHAFFQGESLRYYANIRNNFV